ncbi:hypothetical protein ACMHYJ_11775 [Castellaniella hirudinis]|uniref:P-type ATPase n=1 Tax=Castellaniella hirudinis TaxID=1144617 RepID=UPI0039C1F6A3
MSTLSLLTPPPFMSDAMRRARRHMLARTGLAWLVMMQVMMLAFPGYLRHGVRSAESQQALEQAIVLMNWISLVLCVPLVLYCAWPVWQGALDSLRRGRVGMDVPVALGILAAFIPSIWATWHDAGEVYFESVAMFVAFLLSARFLEFCARQSFDAPDPSAAAVQAALPAADAQLMAQADRVAFWFVCVQIALAALVGAWWWQASPDHALAVTVALLVMSCPCAMSMSVPAALAARRAASLRLAAPACPDALPLDGPSARQGRADLDHATRRIARQNLYGSLIWHVLMTPLAAVGLVQPWLAAITMLLSSLAVAANAWRLARHAPSGGPRAALASPV